MKMALCYIWKEIWRLCYQGLVLTHGNNFLYMEGVVKRGLFNEAPSYVISFPPKTWVSIESLYDLILSCHFPIVPTVISGEKNSQFRLEAFLILDDITRLSKKEWQQHFHQQIFYDWKIIDRMLQFVPANWKQVTVAELFYKLRNLNWAIKH